MLRWSVLFAFALTLVAPAVTSAQDWQVRIDESRDASDPDTTPNIEFTGMGAGGFRSSGGPAGTFWMPGQSATGAYTLSGTFTLNTPSSHTNYYGLVFGGSNLGAPNQQYVYFMVAQNGSFQIRHRNGDQTSNVQGRTPHAAVVRPGANGQSVNNLEVRVAADAINYVVNGTVVHTTPKSGATAVTDGQVGARINHETDVTVSNFQVRR
ncbi:MAG: hypothetical protein AB7G23_11985 [Vicinamibacterales bacterium]